MTRWLDPAENRMWRAWVAMSERLNRAVEQQLIANHGLSAADYALLVPLSEAADERVRSRDLGRAVGWDRSRLSHQIRRMENRGLIVRRRCASDLRGTFIELTEAGRAVIERAAPGHLETVRAHFVDLLTPAEVATLAEVSERVLARLEEIAAPDCGAAGEEDDTVNP